MNEAVDDATLRLRITGKVQGVWFRGWTVKTARGLGLTGWVRNRRDG
ncbi:MAG: acylphosphatase, partial [Alphaproteobacteria bacterium]|nr:acylphosphatase [Alphaproteobacteria bacterium]